MIRTFTLTDLGSFLPNEFSNPDPILRSLVNGTYEVQSMIAEDYETQAIIAFRNYWGSCYLGFVLIAQRFPLPAARTLRKHLQRTMIEKNATRFQTDSVSTPCLRKWHEYLGFDYEGTRKNMMYNQDYDMWALMRQGV